MTRQKRLSSVTGAMRMAVIAACLAGAAQPGVAQHAMTTERTLLDRIQIEDLIVGYYYHLGGGDPNSFGAFYADDAVLDINGKVYRGKDAIAGAYVELSASSPAARGTFHMLLSNPLIAVTGDTATARFIWTGIIQDDVKAPPRFVEQGREYDVLAKRGGQWLITRRTIIADSGLPALYEQTYTPRKDYDPLKDK